MPLEFENGILGIQVQIDKLRDLADRKGIDVSNEVEVLREKLLEISQQTYENLTPMEQVLVARHDQRPYTLDYINLICTDWIELHGDRAFRDDQAIVGGWARIRGRTVMMLSLIHI